MVRHKLKLNSYSMMFNEDGYLISIKRKNQFLRFKQVDVIKDIIVNLGTDKLTVSDLYQVLTQYSMPKSTEVDSKLLIEDIIL